MPVTLHTVDHACWTEDAQAARDLSRIYADAPLERLPSPADEFIRHHLSQGGVFCCARFNDRLLGAVAVQREHEAWWLSHFCVRETTRRRGVGSRLVALVGESARNEGCVLRVAASSTVVGDQLLLSRLGYRSVEGGRYFELNPLASQGGKQ